jgi:tetratricopeptide (TPR) repeat protein
MLERSKESLSHYDDAKLWYERALAADPNHAVTWSYYGMWQAEQGNALKAKDDLEKVRLICGNTDCRPFDVQARRISPHLNLGLRFAECLRGEYGYSQLQAICGFAAQ